jgi:hypothetical protein
MQRLYQGFIRVEGLWGCEVLRVSGLWSLRGRIYDIGIIM